MSAFEDAVIQRIKQLEREVERLQKWERAAYVWQSYTPTWTATTTNPSIGNGTLAGRYVRYGNVCTYILKLLAGSTTTFGSGNWSFSLPLNAANNAGLEFIGVAHMREAGVGYYERTVRIVPSGSSNDKVSHFVALEAGTTSERLSSTVPFTWGNLDLLSFEITYEIA